MPRGSQGNHRPCAVAAPRWEGCRRPCAGRGSRARREGLDAVPGRARHCRGGSSRQLRGERGGVGSEGVREKGWVRGRTTAFEGVVCGWGVWGVICLGLSKWAGRNVGQLVQLGCCLPVTRRHSGKSVSSPRAASHTLGEEVFPQVLAKALGELIFFAFFAPVFCEVFPYYLKLLAQIWFNLTFFVIFC